MKKGLIALLACVFALCFALVGCGGGGADAKAAWVGTWNLSEMEENGQVTSSEDIEMLKQLGLEVYLQLDNDGTGKLAVFGEEMSGKWEAKSATEATMTVDNQTIAMKIADSKLTMEQSGSKLVFVKGAASGSAASASASASAASASASASASGSSSSASS